MPAIPSRQWAWAATLRDIKLHGGRFGEKLVNALVAALLLLLAYLFAADGLYFFAAIALIALAVLALGQGKATGVPRMMHAGGKEVSKAPGLAELPGSYIEPTEHLAKNAGTVVAWPARVIKHIAHGKPVKAEAGK